MNHISKVPAKGTPERREYFQKIGAKGGRHNVWKNGVEHMTRIGTLGGETMARTHGKEFYSKIGRMSKKELQP